MKGRYTGLDAKQRAMLRVDRFQRMIPEPFRAELLDYLVAGSQPGPFVAAVLSGDLFASIESKPLSAPKGSIGKLAAYLKAHAPHRAFGSPERFRVWVRTGGLRGKGGDKC